MNDSPLSTLAAPSFEFGKRKRWADLVITELVDVLLLVLSPLGKVLYCGNGLKNTLGWNETNLIDCDFHDLIHVEDQEKFTHAFELSLESGEPMLSVYVRLKSTTASSSSSTSSPPHELFELVGRPQIVAAEDTGGENPLQVVFLVAKPYPSKSIETLNTYVELEEEHERLQQRVAELRARAPRSIPSSPASSSGSSAGGVYTTSSMTRRPLANPPQPYSNDPVPEPEDDEESSRKKKIPRKTAPSEQYACITCGRTDSPEWRKVYGCLPNRFQAILIEPQGPSGPKTLCNACGLRYAKQLKLQKLAEEAAAGGSA